MASLAVRSPMRSLGARVSPDSPRTVDRERYWLQVIGVNATSVTAEMVDGQTESDGSTQNLIRHPVGESPPMLDVLDTVAVTIDAAGPQPATGIGLWDEPLSELIHPCALIPPRMSGAIPQGYLH